jgi:hypothetical protein
MIGKSVGTAVVHGNSLPGNVLAPTTTGSSSSGDPAATAILQPTSPRDSGGPLQPLAPAAAQPLAGHVQAPPVLASLARARNLIGDFVTATCRNVPGSDARHRYLVAQARTLERSLNDAINTAKSNGPIAGKTKTGLIRLLEKAIEVHYELSQWKGTAKEDEVNLLHRCMDMHDDLQQAITPRVIQMAEITSRIARKAHAIYFKMATGVQVERTVDGFALMGTPCRAPQVKLLECARAASMNVRAEASSHKPRTLPLADMYSVHELQDLPLDEAVDGTKLTKREIDLWCANPPQNPWPVEPRLLRFYDAAKFAAQGVRARENNEMRHELVAQHMPHNPDPQLAARDNRANMADLIAGFAADLPDDRP